MKKKRDSSGQSSRWVDDADVLGAVRTHNLAGVHS